MNIRAIPELRKKAGLTQAELARRLGVQPLAVARWETGTRELKLSAIGEIASAIGVTEQFLAQKIFAT